MARRLRDWSVEAVKERADLLAVVSETVKLHRSGPTYMGHCPFKAEKNPSFNVDPAKGLYNCFSCGEGGSVVDFVMKTRGLAFREAVEELAERFGIALEYEGREDAARDRKVEGALRALAAAQAAYAGALGESREAREYLASRGVSPEAVEAFGIGFSADNVLMRALSEAKVTRADAGAAGLLASEGGKWRERFRRRIMFPIRDARGRTVGFGGRTIGGGGPKYLNGPSTCVYGKGFAMFGLSAALQEIQRLRSVVVVEGYLDLVGCWQAGVRNVAATCGTAMTADHARTLLRYADRVTLMYDADLPGKKAMVRAAETLYGAGCLSPRAVVPPGGADPHDWSRVAAPGEMALAASRALPVLEIVERGLASRLDGSCAARLGYLKAMEGYLGWVADPIERIVYLQRMEASAGLPKGSLVGIAKGSPLAEACKPE